MDHLYRLLFVSLCFLVTPPASAVSKLTAVEVQVSAVQEVEVTYSLSMELVCTLANGKVKTSTRNKLSRFGWENFNVYVSGGSFHQGGITVDPVFTHQLNDSLYIKVVYKEDPKINARLAYHIPFPVSLSVLREEDPVISHTSFYDPAVELGYSDGTYRKLKLTTLLGANIGAAMETNGYYKPAVGIGTPEGLTYLPEINMIVQLPTFQLVHPTRFPTSYSEIRVMDFNARKGDDRLLAWDGDDGGDAEPVEVYVRMHTYGDRPYLHVLVASKQRWEAAIIHTGGEGLLIEAYGGNGGDGGDGSDGSNGCDETSLSDATDGEIGEDGGNGGNGGRGAEVTIHSDADSAPFLSLIEVRNSGGKGGEAGLGGHGGRGGSLKDGTTMSDGNYGVDGIHGHDGGNGPTHTYLNLAKKVLDSRMKEIMDKASRKTSSVNSIQGKKRRNTSALELADQNAAHERKGFAYFTLGLLLLLAIAGS